MNKKLLFSVLNKQNKQTLIALLSDSYDLLSEPEAFRLFSFYYEKSFPKKSMVSRTLADINQFYQDSYAHKYYAPFSIDSKNFSHIPEQTELWFELLADYFDKTLLLHQQGEHELVVQCFGKLYQLLNDMCEDIVFADELGGWMLNTAHKDVMPKYIESLSLIAEPTLYAEKTVMMMQLDEYDYPTKKVFKVAKKFSNKEQKAALLAIIDMDNNLHLKKKIINNP